MDANEQVTFQVAAEVPLPLRITVAPPKGDVKLANREFAERGPHQCSAAEWKRLERRTVGIPLTEKVDGEDVIIGRKTVRCFELVTPADSTPRSFRGKKEEPDEAA